jgi:hypothetical protein
MEIFLPELRSFKVPAEPSAFTISVLLETLMFNCPLAVSTMIDSDKARNAETVPSAVISCPGTVVVGVVVGVVPVVVGAVVTGGAEVVGAVVAVGCGEHATRSTDTNNMAPSVTKVSTLADFLRPLIIIPPLFPATFKHMNFKCIIKFTSMEFVLSIR